MQVCSLNSQTNVLSGCTTSTLSGVTRSPTGVVVKNGAAWVASDSLTCGVIYCSSAATMTGCSCPSLPGVSTFNSAKGISMSPAQDKLYVEGVVTLLGAEGVVACDLGTSATNCVAYSLSPTYSGLTGLYASSTKLYMYDADTAGLGLTSKVLICDATNPTSCTVSSTAIGTGLSGVTRNGPWGLSTFDSKAYIPDNDQIIICSDVNTISGCTNQNALTILGAATSSTAGAVSIFIYPRV